MTIFEILLYFVIAVTAIVLIVLLLNRKKVPGISTDEDVVDLIRSGDMLKAIKAYRQLHGTGLKEAKLFVENHKGN